MTDFSPEAWEAERRAAEQHLASLLDAGTTTGVDKTSFLAANAPAAPSEPTTPPTNMDITASDAVALAAMPMSWGPGTGQFRRMADGYAGAVASMQAQKPKQGFLGRLFGGRR